MITKPRIAHLLALALLLLAGLASAIPLFDSHVHVALSEQEESFDPRDHYDKAEHMVPMRDGVELFTIVYTPKDTSQAYPILLFRTPYSAGPYGVDNYRKVLGPSQEFDRDGYIFVFQDVRGQFKSEGEFEVMRALARDPSGRRSDPAAVDESTDNYDTIEWVLDNIPNHNGRVGQWGISYAGWQTVMGMVDAHPALKASSPQASPSDMFIGDDWHHNGAFRLMYAFSWLSRNARTRQGPTETRGARFDYGTPWGYRFFLELGTVAKISELYFHDQVPAWNEFMEHGAYDEYWQKQNALLFLDDIDHPILNVAGWFDAEDFYGPMSIYYTIEEKNPDNRSTLAAGPWLHGGWRSMPGNALGCIDFGSETSRHFQREVQFPFFSYYLKDKGDWGAPEAVVFETGSNVWKSYDRWPPQGVVTTPLYFHEGGKLSFEAPEDSADANDSYVSDPDKPVPFSAEVRTTQGHLWMIEDQRFAATRPDVLVYESDVLTEDVTIAGPIIATLYASTSGTDSDFIVKLIDVYPGDAQRSPHCNVPIGDFQMLLAGEVFRAKFRASYENPEPMVPDRITKIEFDLRDRNHTFRKGHRIMVQVQSTWFPVIDRNPQKFVDIYRAEPSDFQKATQKIYRSAEFPSHLTLGVLRKDSGATPAAGAGAAAQAGWDPRVEVTVPKAPTPFPADGKVHLAYELHLTNYSRTPMKLERVDALGLEKVERLPSLPRSLVREPGSSSYGEARVLGSTEGKNVRSQLYRPGTPRDPAALETIGGGMSAVVYMWVTVGDDDEVPAMLAHRLSFSSTIEEDGVETTRTGVLETGLVRVNDNDPVVIGPPLRGDGWLAANGPSNASGHRRAIVPVSGRARHRPAVRDRLGATLRGRPDLAGGPARQLQLPLLRHRRAGGRRRHDRLNEGRHPGKRPGSELARCRDHSRDCRRQLRDPRHRRRGLCLLRALPTGQLTGRNGRSRAPRPGHWAGRQLRRLDRAAPTFSRRRCQLAARRRGPTLHLRGVRAARPRLGLPRAGGK